MYISSSSVIAQSLVDRKGDQVMFRLSLASLTLVNSQDRPYVPYVQSTKEIRTVIESSQNHLRHVSQMDSCVTYTAKATSRSILRTSYQPPQPSLLIYDIFRMHRRVRTYPRDFVPVIALRSRAVDAAADVNGEAQRSREQRSIRLRRVYDVQFIRNDSPSKHRDQIASTFVCIPVVAEPFPMRHASVRRGYERGTNNRSRKMRGMVIDIPRGALHRTTHRERVYEVHHMIGAGCQREARQSAVYVCARGLASIIQQTQTRHVEKKPVIQSRISSEGGTGDAPSTDVFELSIPHK
ncbi:hypothetical protein BDN70DRAFT_898622 [Pholiota conissans]|uniref:Uncharacterized protein n=1 Tax=Pholiota conissans TaxID=109636 RepID=A0A9P6CWS5_9AGAR|nr:hypothetical protein BDN70DRAFT_898622 [Pholiota conissans]